VNGNYTYLVAEDAETGEQLDRRPENRAFAELAYVDPGNASLSVNGLYVGERTDSYYDASMFEFVNTDLDEYFVLNVAGSYNITPGVELMARIDNVLDEDYEESAGYGTPGLSAYGGFKITL
jgi:vitamin B12 transporter